MASTCTTDASAARHTGGSTWRHSVASCFPRTRSVAFATSLPRCQPGRPAKVKVVKTEEKGSDVNLASYLLLDGFRGDCDPVVVLSNDSDLREPLRMARQELGLSVGVINPHLPGHRSRELSEHATFFKQLRRAALKSCLFPDELVDAAGAFRKPPGW